MDSVLAQINYEQGESRIIGGRLKIATLIPKLGPETRQGRQSELRNVNSFTRSETVKPNFTRGKSGQFWHKIEQN